jgi:Rrf2 family protein
MRLSTKGRYAVTAMLDLALNSGKGPVTLADISVNQGISLSYLEQLFAALRGKQLVRGVRGPGGGYYLGKPRMRSPSPTSSARSTSGSSSPAAAGARTAAGASAA